MAYTPTLQRVGVKDEATATLSQNRLVLQAKVTEVSPLRYTPAGIPALNFTLKSEGQVLEDQQRRQVILEIRSKAIGHSITKALQAFELGTEAVFMGFLAAARNGRGVVFHVNSFSQVDASATTDATR
jgi:primosomal replication protein N